MAESRPFLASAYRIRRFVREHALADRPHTSLWLAKTYVIPADIYGSHQVWGTVFLQAGREFSSSLSTLHLHFLKGTLGVKQSTTNWAVIRECGHDAMLLVVSHLGAPPSGRVRCQATTQLAVQRPSAPTISVVMLQILFSIGNKPRTWQVQCSKGKDE